MTCSRRIGIIGGTFDPIHVGHLVAAEFAREAYDLEKVVFIPAGDPPHKVTNEVTPAQHRYAMTKLATETNPDFSVSRIEIERTGKSFTVDTLHALTDESGRHDRLFFIMGADSLADLSTWYQPELILSLCEVIAVTRPEWDFEQSIAGLGPLYDQYKTRIHRLDIPGLNIKSREIRDRVRHRMSIRYMTPDVVVDYIIKEKLYVNESIGGEHERGSIKRGCAGVNA